MKKTKALPPRMRREGDVYFDDNYIAAEQQLKPKKLNRGQKRRAGDIKPRKKKLF